MSGKLRIGADDRDEAGNENPIISLTCASPSSPQYSRHRIKSKIGYKVATARVPKCPFIVYFGPFFSKFAYKVVLLWDKMLLYNSFY